MIRLQELKLCFAMACVGGCLLLSSSALGITYDPSPELLKIVGVSAYTRVDDIKMKIRFDDLRTASGLLTCDNARLVNLTVTSGGYKVTMIKVAVETEAKKHATALASIINHGGLSYPFMSNHMRLDLFELHKLGVPLNIWTFYFTAQGVYANSIKIRCASADHGL
mgnify:CR=1 FL=1